MSMGGLVQSTQYTVLRVRNQSVQVETPSSRDLTGLSLERTGGEKNLLGNRLLIDYSMRLLVVRWRTGVHFHFLPIAGRRRCIGGACSETSMEIYEHLA